MKYKKILIITYALNQGGMEQSLSRLVKYLKDEENAVSILLTENKGDWFDLFNENYCSAVCIPESKGGAVIHLFRIRDYIVKSNCDILYIVCDKFTQSIIPLLPRRIKIISAVRLDDAYFYYLASTNQSFVDAYAVNSLKLHDELKKLIKDQPIEIIHNGFQIPNQETIEKRTKYEIPLKLLFLGRIAAEKNVLILPDIIRKCIDLKLNVTLNIVGDGPLMSELKSKIKLLKLETYINIIGSVSNNEAQSWYLQSHVLLFPSLSEGLPNVLIESQGCGCVPISNLLPKVTDTVVAENNTGFIAKNNDVDEYVEKIIYLYQNPNICSTLSKNAIEWIEQNFSTTQEKKKYINIFNNVITIEKRKYRLINPFQIFRLIHIRDWTPLKVKNIKHKIEKFFT